MTIQTAASPRKLLKKVFGFAEFRPGQEAVVEHLLAGRSSLAIFPTGGGKSICYQLPALMMEGVTLVISPLIALMKDQLDFLQRHGVPAARLDSSLPLEEVRQVYADLKSGRLKLLYVAPERLSNERFLQTLRHQRIAMLAVDEAHCLSEWGHNFRPDYLKLPTLAHDLGVERVLALTATATPNVAANIAQSFAIAPECVIQTGFYRPNLTLRVTPSRLQDRSDLLLERLRSRPAGPTIVYVTLQQTAEDVAATLSAAGLPAKAYHAGMETDERNAVQDWFMQSQQAVVVATIAFGMGIDKSDIRYVYHYNLPKGLESYAQEIGRAGRDGLESTCEMLACGEDVITLENFSYGDTPTPEAIRSLVDELLSQGDKFDVSIYELSGNYDIRPLVVETLLTYLELDGILASTGPFYNEYKFQPQRSSAEILARFDADRAAFLRKILSRAKKASTWFHLDLHEASQAIGETRERIIVALNYLEEQGDLVLRVAGVRQGYRLLQAKVDLKELCASLIQRFQERESRDIGRVRKVLDLAQHQGCTTGFLLNYFGEQHADCGHCGWCLGERPGPLATVKERVLTKTDAQLVAELRGENHAPLATSRQLARFLCGLNSPATTRAKLHRDGRFGRLARSSFGEVLKFIERS